MNKYIAIILLAFSVSAFAETVTYICDYTTYSDQEGLHQAEDNFVLTFIVDKTAKKTYMLGNLGTVEIRMLEGKDQIAFINVTDVGNVMTTAIDMNLDSVHSRNSVIWGKIVPSQYYGKCEKK